jgi:anti-sigma regulatory factor (Ser/Thr protein kinase)
VSSEPLTLRFPARADHVGAVRRAVCAYAREHAVADPDDVALAVSEVVTNAIIHAYVGAPAPGEIEVAARCIEDDGLEVDICDQGRGMIPRVDSPGLGVGLAVVASVAKQVEIEARPTGGTRVFMVFETVTPA